MTKETISAIIGGLALIFKKPIEMLLTKAALYLTDRLPFVKKKRKRIKDAKKIVEIDKVIAALGNRYQFNRVTIATYGNYKSLPVTMKEFEKLKITITNEWTDNTNTIMQDFQNASCVDLAYGLFKLNDSMLAWIEIPPAEQDYNLDMANTISMQNMLNVVKSYRFKLGNHVVEGSMEVSFTNDSAVYGLGLEDLQYLRSVAKKIYSIMR